MLTSPAVILDRYLLGNLLRLSGVFTVDEIPTDPGTATIKILPPSGTVVSLTYPGDAAIVRLSTGSYYTDYLPTEVGLHTFQWSGTGSVKALDESNFKVDPPTIS